MKRNYKDTLLMPKTSFEMRGNLVQKDLLFIKKNIEDDLINKLKKRNGFSFILHDGPPYANGDIHLGHALNKILKDIIVRNKILEGAKLNLIPGWDTFGLPIENEIQKQGINLKNTPRDEYLRKCYSYARKQVDRQEKQFKKLNLLFDFKNKYLTLQNDYVANEIKIFHKMLNDKLIYQDLKPIYWSYSSKTALADAEIEYSKTHDDACYVSFKLDENTNILIWTTTPWTLPANVALAFGKHIKYKLVKLFDKQYIIASDLIKKVEREIRKNFEIISNFNPEKIIGQKAKNPINNNDSKIVWGHHVTIENGTGIVHIAGGHGNDDYLIVKENNLKLFVVVDDEGMMINTRKYDGLFYKKANIVILNDLTKSGNLLYSEKIHHSIPIDWRTKLPIIYRATKQWFVSLDKIKKELIQKGQEANWIPSWGKNRITKMIEGRDDWCISRQRSWGVPIPIIYDQKNLPIIDESLQKNIENLFKEKGIIGWKEASIKELLPKHIKYHPKMRKEKDILDVWFDSGSSHVTVLQDKQADIYLEGNDQYRGWFNSSLITSYVLNKRAPYKNVITHGFTIDEKGYKMSKSIGNTIDPIDFINKYGSDILRLWVASSDYFSNLKFTDKIINSTINDYKKIRNTIRYILGNISDYNNDFDGEYSFIGKTILSNLSKLQREIVEGYKEFKFVRVIKKIINEITSDSLAYYLDYVKDVIYIEKKDSQIRKEAQSILKYAFEIILFAIAPILPTTAEDAYQHYNFARKNNLFLDKREIFNLDENNYWETFNKIREKINTKIEELREKKIINRSFEASVELNLSNKYHLLDIKNLKDLLLVGEIKLNFWKKDYIEINIKQFNGIKCNRCWKLWEEEEMIDDICKRCHSVIN